ncbi:MAG TPA: hypothetical protein VEB86_20150 [Chryseosolibacter sp.]|nr:hypothetical protein [Chryseosolibacter sp.]
MLLRTYTPVWHKYRPVLLKMMIDSKDEPKTYQLSAHEFRALNARQKGGYSFVLQVSNGKVKNNIRNTTIAQDLWEVLQLSPKANELIQQATYQFAMDNNYLLRVETLESVNN